MTIGAWVVLVVLNVVCIAIPIAVLVSASESKETITIGVCVDILICFLCSALFVWYRSTSEGGKRSLKDQESNLSGGIERTVSVYDINGVLIKQYDGKFDIETDRNNYILFDDETGKRHVIYYTTGTVIVDEK